MSALGFELWASSFKIFKSGCRLDCRKFSFGFRSVDLWNSLDEDIIACNSVDLFKNRLDAFLKGRGVYISCASFPL